MFKWNKQTKNLLAENRGFFKQWKASDRERKIYHADIEKSEMLAGYHRKTCAAVLWGVGRCLCKWLFLEGV